MKKNNLIILCLFLFFSCQESPKSTTQKIENGILKTIEQYSAPTLNLAEANRLAQLPLHCAEIEYPNKLSQTIDSQEDLQTPKTLHPAFYGCFDWHSAVHGHWSMVSLLKQFPDITSADTLKTLLLKHISEENITKEVAYFNGKHNKSWERTYGWAWLLKLAEELHIWDDPLARKLENNLQPLTDLIVGRFKEFLPKLHYPIRVGEHSNTAFGMAFAYDYAVAVSDKTFIQLIEKRARDFYFKDSNCPITWEPSGFDFLSPCLEEMDIMRRVLPDAAFKTWMHDFLPQLKNPNYDLAVGEISDRTDGKLVHLEGVNFSRAWCLYGLANQYPEYKHLKNIANKHMQHSLPNIVGDSYEGGHWLGSFAIYALNNIPEKI